MSEKKSNSPEVTVHLSLNAFSSDFNALHKEELTAYTFLLYDHNDIQKIKKTILLQLLIFVSHLVKASLHSARSTSAKWRS